MYDGLLVFSPYIDKVFRSSFKEEFSQRGRYYDTLETNRLNERLTSRVKGKGQRKWVRVMAGRPRLSKMFLATSHHEQEVFHDLWWPPRTVPSLIPQVPNL